MYVFLSVFFVFFLSLESLLDFDTGFNLKPIVSSYLMIDGIGFVWVFKVYFILAIVTPLALFLMKSKMKNYMYFLFLLIIYVIYECMVVALTGVDNKYVQVFFEKFVLLAIPYSLLYIYGMRLNTLSNKTVILIAVCSLLAFIIIANYLYIDKGNIISTQEYKYPPRIYYLAYAFFAIHFIYLFVMNIKISSSKYLSIISFLSKNSLWIYLWHIFAYYIWFFTMPETEHEIVTSLLMMLYLFLFGVGMSYLQMRLVNHLLESSKNNLINRFYKVLL
jgi:hypothetical protein